MYWQVATAYQSDTGRKNIKEDTHLIRVYTDNYANTDEVMKVERELRSLGINDVLKYKPYIYTLFDIYNKNKYEIKVSLYTTNGPLPWASLLCNTTTEQPDLASISL